MGAQQVGLVSGEPMPAMMLTPSSVNGSAVLGLAFVQAIAASLLGALLLQRNYAWSWLSGGEGISLGGAGTPIVTLTSISLTPVVRTGVLQLRITGPTMFERVVEIPVRIQHG